jgi:hypothetical protein
MVIQTKSKTTEYNLNPELCSKCGGRCCQNYPGAYFPEDFEILSVEVISGLLREGKASLDWWEGDPRPHKCELDRGYFLRSSTLNSRGIFDPTWGGVCIHWSTTGCLLAPKDRPSQCLLLVPSSEFENCIPSPEGGKDKTAIRWLPYEALLLEAAKRASDGK